MHFPRFFFQKHIDMGRDVESFRDVDGPPRLLGLGGQHHQLRCHGLLGYVDIGVDELREGQRVALT